MFIERPMMNAQGMMAPPQFEEIKQEKFERFEQFRQMEIGAAGIYGRPEDLKKCGPQPPIALQVGCRLVCKDIKWESICEDKIGDLARCGPRPAMPTPQGCVGPVCKDGRWDFECKDFNGEDRPVNGGIIPSQTNTGDERSGILCTQEYNPVCGANDRTYPNKCFAEKGEVEIKHAGPCGDLRPTSSSGMPPGGVGGIQPQSEEEAREMMEVQQQMMREKMMQQQIMPINPPIYQQPGVIAPPPEFIKIPPQSKRNMVDYFFATIFEGFGGLFRRR